MMRLIPERRWLLAVAAAALLVFFLLVSAFTTTQSGADRSLLCTLTSSLTSSPPSDAVLSTQLSETILHYVTTSVVPQQNRAEIRISLDVLLARRPCNFLVFGLGHDSLMWRAFNPGGTTVFLEEDPKWVATVLKDAPTLAARSVKYPTQLSQADDLLRTYKDEPDCLPARAFVKGNRRCRLALADLPGEVYDREWDLIMIDAPRGYFPEAPGRMGAIWTAAVMARNRKAPGDTDVFLHDVNRKVEKEFALEFLCKKYLVKGSGRLWHFRIPAVRPGADQAGSFC